MKRVAVCLALSAFAIGATAKDAGAPAVEFTPAEIRSILSHGPWPPAGTRDPSNRVSGDPAAIAFGERLFFDTRLSSNGQVSCAACHQPMKKWADGREKAVGLAGVDRNSPTLTNLRGQRWYGWDGSNDSLWSQSVRPMLDPREMGMTPRTVADTIRREPDLACRYAAAFSGPPSADDEAVLVNAGKALAAFQETLVSGRTPFDEFRDALARGDRAAMAGYPESAQRGLKLFVGRGNCTVCHVGPKFTNDEFSDIGIGFFIAPGRVDPGRHEGIKRVQANRYNLLGAWSDDAARSTAISTRLVRPEHRNFGEFKVPSLRNVADTAPYMHNGSLKSLLDVVRHYSDIDEERLHADGERILKRIGLSQGESADLVAFLKSLSDGTPPFRRTQTDHPQCN